MNYDLYCVVNAAGVPYNDTFRPTGEDAWATHRWRDVPKDGEHRNSCTLPTLDAHENKLRANGDRIVPVRVTTSETVTLEFPPQQKDSDS